MTGTAEQVAIWASQLKGDGRLYDFTIHREKRSRSQNSYYWELLGRLSRKINKPMAAVHNELLRNYGAPEMIDGDLITVMVPDTDAAETEIEAAEYYHLKPTSHVEADEDGYRRMYIMLKGSHDMNTEEMSGLLSGLIEECRIQGIETMTPDELERLRRIEHDRDRWNG